MAIRQDPESWLWSNRRWKRNRQAEEAVAAAEEKAEAEAEDQAKD